MKGKLHETKGKVKEKTGNAEQPNLAAKAMGGRVVSTARTAMAPAVTAFASQP